MKDTTVKDSAIKKLWTDALKTASPRPISVSRADLVNTYCLHSEKELPLVIEPRLGPIKLHDWAESNVEFINEKLLRYGALLFRGFALGSQSDFEGFLRALRVELLRYMESATPRTELGDRIYTSTEFPPDQTIALHNELTYVSTWPMKIWFFCETPAEKGGETPIADVRNVLNRIDDRIREEFVQKGWQLVRNYGDGYGPTWQQAFHLTDKDALEEYCQVNRIEYEWKGTDRLRTRQVRPAVAVHPKTHERVWFNHIAFWHVSSLAPELREILLQEFGDSGLPYNTFYGDGSSIEPSIVEVLRRSYSQETAVFEWQKGDLLMLDNMLVAHGRAPFVGRRRVLAAMGETGA